MPTHTLPVVVFAFANDKTRYLHLLKQESGNMNEIISPLHDKGAIEMHREESANVEEIASIFQRFDQRIAIFHYGGHAGGSGLHLEEGLAGAEGLASYFEQQKENLKLVFLNGCSTLPQVELLMNLGIKAVIATSVPIEDPKAVEFAKEFYRGLSVRQPIGRAFTSASSMLRTKYDGVEAPGIIEFRGGVNWDNKKTADFPWGLYVKEENKDILDWRLPVKAKRIQMSSSDNKYSSNQYLKYVLDAMLYLDDDLREELTNDDGLLVDTQGSPLNDQQKFYIILKNLPWPIGAQFQKLVALRALNLERLKQIASTYLVTSQTLLYLIIAQMIEAADKNRDEDWSLLREALTLNRKSFRTFDFLGQIKKLHYGDFFNAESPPFVSEILPFLEELQDEKSDLYKAYLELEELRDSIQEDRMDWGQAVDFYGDAEASLTILLSRVAFMVKYRLIAVRDIQIVNYRHSEIKYLHRLGELNGVGDTLGLSPRELTRFTNCDSILLVRDINDLGDAERGEDIINLTPLLIDENAFLGYSTDVLNIYMYAFKEGEDYYYYKVNSNIFHVMDQEEKFLVVNNRIPEDEDELFIRFMPIVQNDFIRKATMSNSEPNPVRASKNTNPYAKLVEQMENIFTTIGAKH